MKEKSESNLTLTLLKIVGSPFVLPHEFPETKMDAFEIYKLASKNKIGLLYLETLNKYDKLEEFGLVSKFEEEKRKRSIQSITLTRICEVFNNCSDRYAVFKSVMPFPATPNDVDIIHFGSDVEYEKITEHILANNYIEIKGEVDASQRMFHDLRECDHPDLHKKDVYDIDIYQKISASRVTYLDKRKLEKYVTVFDVSGTKVRGLIREAELVAIIIHSIVPEMISTLFVYYATLYYIAEMSHKDIDRFINIARENNVVFSVISHCSLISELHKQAHGFSPEKIEYILLKMGSDGREKKGLINKDYKFPHNYSLLTVSKILLEKTKEYEFMKSTIDQMIYMLNPKVTKWVIMNILWRRNRDSY